MTNQPWWQTAVFYQIYPRSFYDSNGDGLGDLNGVIEKLDYLKSCSPDSLGIDAIWLSPVTLSPQKDFGYDVRDYRRVDPIFGDLDAFRRLISAAHAHRIRVVLDLVVNHTSDQHPWFTAARGSIHSDRRDWYIWREGRTGGRPPNNWQSPFGGSAWRLDETTGEYYLHSFLPEQPDLNWRNPGVQSAVWEIMRYWLDLGVDGFRLDVYNFYFKDARFRSNPRRLSWRGLFYPYDGQKHIHDQDQPELYEVLSKMRNLLDEYPGERMLVGETSTTNHFNRAFSYYGEHQNGLHLVFNFEFLQCGWRADPFRRAIRHWQQFAPKDAWPTWVLGNHDVIRHFTRYGRGKHGVNRAKAAAALLLTLRGTPFLYYGEEIGMEQARLPRRLIQDPPGRRFWPFYRGRDGCRTPMQWNATRNAGFTTGEPWLPVNPNFNTVNLERQQADPASLWNFYRQLITLRKKYPALLRGTLHILSGTARNVLVFRRSAGSQTLWIAVNFSRRKAIVNLNFPKTLKVLLATQHAINEALSGSAISLAPEEVLICGKLTEGNSHAG